MGCNERSVMMSVSVLVPYAQADFRSGEIFHFAFKLVAVLAADGDVHFAHGVAEAIAHIDGRAVVALDLIVDVGDNKTRLGACRNDTGLKLVGVCGVGQFSRAYYETCPAAVRLPALPVSGGVAGRKEALHEDRVRIAYVLGVDDFIEQSGRQDIGQDLRGTD
jgi:hypothetical protein